jgi:tRNA pseudouridine55 synthase
MTRRGTGVLVVDKGPGVTSFQVVARLRRALRASKVGHGGTLDPSATGVLPILVGEATKLSPYLIDHDKEYVATIRLGVTTDTHDLTGQIRATAPVPSFDRNEIDEACRRLTGVIRQVPPMYSAVRHQGRRLYELARAGVEVERPARDVIVHGIVVEAIDLPRLTLRIACGRGTYVRTLAADLGEILGVGAAVEQLVRTRVGPLTIEHAIPWSQVLEADGVALWARVWPPDAALPEFPEVALADAAEDAFLHGQSVDSPALAPGTLARVYGAGRRFLGIGRILPGERVTPERILHADLPGPSVLPA